eukprot:scaffold29486_cov110-Isochrysis_galbana.AAC.2
MSAGAGGMSWLDPANILPEGSRRSRRPTGRRLIDELIEQEAELFLDDVSEDELEAALIEDVVVPAEVDTDSDWADAEQEEEESDDGSEGVSEREEDEEGEEEDSGEESDDGSEGEEDDEDEEEDSEEEESGEEEGDEDEADYVASPPKRARA